MDYLDGIYGNFQVPPEFRADPFQSYLGENGMVVGFVTVVVPSRGKRPREIRPEKKETKKFPKSNLLLEIARGKEYAIIVSTNQGFVNNPFEENLEPSKTNIDAEAITILNKFPMFSRDKAIFPHGVMLVTFPTTEIFYPKENHNAVFKMLKSIQVALEGIGQSVTDQYQIINFFNIGPNSGASLRQLHSQTYYWRHRQPIIGKELLAFQEAFRKNGCLACKSIGSGKIRDPFGNEVDLDDLKIFEDENVIVIFAFAPIRLLQTRVIIKKHNPNLLSLTDPQLRSLAKGISIADDAIFEVSSYINFKFEDRSIAFRENYGENFHLLIDVLPAWPLAGAELVSSMTFASRPPEKAAEIYRNRKSD